MIRFYLPDSGTVNWILIALLVVHVTFDLVTMWSPVALRYLAAWAVARAAGLDALTTTTATVKRSEQTRLGLGETTTRSDGAFNSLELTRPESVLELESEPER